ncbi:TetR/AcrR family transcriptional regulator [Nocardia uniformis]|uniref:TetR/AcrR family transcriptional regulator n=1 Tax=Nocardia uniformis TaxID=53432 RepID=A0A849BU93_9NOCA|nr:TetR/AcrR family transcriptional regulator [Nocardia uniformis]NNH68426.1 TetR/AcrR family transcriptional regulator [Nocardia uniformis]
MANPRDIAGDSAGGSGLGQSARPAAHRPSRRHHIIDAAVAVFAHKGFAETSVQEIAAAAGMAPAAVYYHFASKEELFDVALRSAMDASSAAAEAAWPHDTPADENTLDRIVTAVWEWTARNPDAFRLLSRQVQGGSTAGSRVLAAEYVARHEHRTFDYFAADPIPASRRAAAAAHAVRSLRIRTMIVTTIAIHPHRLDDGPLADIPDDALRAALVEVCHRMIKGPGGATPP